MLCMCEYMCVCVYLCVCVCMYVCICVCMCVCVLSTVNSRCCFLGLETLLTLFQSIQLLLALVEKVIVKL